MGLRLLVEIADLLRGVVREKSPGRCEQELCLGVALDVLTLAAKFICNNLNAVLFKILRPLPIRGRKASRIKLLWET